MDEVPLLRAAVGVSMTERWLPVPGYEGHYEVSDLGRVRALPRRTLHVSSRFPNGRWHTLKGGLRKLSCIDPGYLYLNLRLPEGGKALRSVHSLVLEAFVGPRPEGMVTRHLNGDRTDARLENLTYGTPSENMYDRRAHGTDHNAAKTHCIRGHEFTPENTLEHRPGQRGCRACSNERGRNYRRRLREARLENAS